MAELAQDLRIALRQLGRRSRLYRDCNLDPGAGNRRQHRNIQRIERHAAENASRPRSAGALHRSADKLVERSPEHSGHRPWQYLLSYPVFQALRQNTNVLADVIAHIPLGYGKVPVRLADTPTEKAGEEVSGKLFLWFGSSDGTGRA